MGEIWREAITDSFHKFLEKVLTFLPNLLAMVTILIVGFIIAWIVRKLVIHLLKAIHFDRLTERWGLAQALSKGGLTYSTSNLFEFITLLCMAPKA